MISVSIVSHGHGDMVVGLVGRILQCPLVSQVFVVWNIVEQASLPQDHRIIEINNPTARGFGENHNSAFQRASGDYFCVLNPDVTLVGDPFPQLLKTLQANGAALVAPRIISPSGTVEDSVRRFPTAPGLLAKLFLGDEGRISPPSVAHVTFVEWVAGMFMLFRSSDFGSIGGFDERFFLYYEDVDICARLHLKGAVIVADLAVDVVHDAQRASRRSLRHARWHLSSMARYLLRYRMGFSKIPIAKVGREPASSIR